MDDREVVAAARSPLWSPQVHVRAEMCRPPDSRAHACSPCDLVGDDARPIVDHVRMLQHAPSAEPPAG